MYLEKDWRKMQVDWIRSFKLDGHGLGIVFFLISYLGCRSFIKCIYCPSVVVLKEVVRNRHLKPVSSILWRYTLAVMKFQDGFLALLKGLWLILRLLDRYILSPETSVWIGEESVSGGIPVRLLCLFFVAVTCRGLGGTGGKIRFINEWNAWEETVEASCGPRKKWWKNVPCLECLHEVPI